MSQYALRVPDSLLARACKIAEQEHASLNQFFVVAIAEKLASMESEQIRISKRAQKAKPGAALKMLSRVKNRAIADDDDRMPP